MDLRRLRQLSSSGNDRAGRREDVNSWRWTTAAGWSSGNRPLLVQHPLAIGTCVPACVVTGRSRRLEDVGPLCAWDALHARFAPDRQTVPFSQDIFSAARRLKDLTPSVAHRLWQG
jgi:hypothetical protein